MILVESILVVLSFLLAMVAPKLEDRRFAAIERAVTSFSRRQMLSVVIVGLLAIVARISVLGILPIPNPGIPDEFGHLLAGDTFAHGRLTNPTHPMWIHLENLSEIQQPSYASKYPPAQGVVLAIGQVSIGHPFWGVCLSTGLMCAAICWMLQAWMPPQWALLGGLLAIIRLGMFSYWANSYWGGAIAATGGALLLGALPRIKRSPSFWNGLTMSLGLALLANSRPYEGLVLACPVLIAVVIRLIRTEGIERKRIMSRVVIPLAACGALAALGMMYYNWRVTGSPARMPYQVAQDTYYSTPLFLWQPLRPMPQYHHAAFRTDMETWEVPVYRGGRAHPVLMAEARVFFLVFFFYGPALVAPFLLLPYVLPRDFRWKQLSSNSRLLVSVIVISVVAALLPLFFNPGYSAPLTAALYALSLKALSRIRDLEVKGRLTGIAFSRYLMMTCVLLVIVRCAAGPLHLQLYGPRTWFSLDFQLGERARLYDQLSRSGARNVVIVRNAENGMRGGMEWVFNDADIDNAKVIWARDMGPERNAELIRYFKNRKIWSVEPDVGAASLAPYTDRQQMTISSGNSAVTVK